MEKKKTPRIILHEAETIDITPTWAGLLPYFFLALENGNTEGRKIAREELAKMARAADLYNAMVKEAR